MKDLCTKTAFSFDDEIYKQIDGVLMGLPLRPVLANEILTEFEKIVVDNLINNDLIKFYITYVDELSFILDMCMTPWS